jgi:hypothetical protein
MLRNAKKRKGNRIDGQFLSRTRIINEDVIDGRTEERTLTCCDRRLLMSLILWRKESRDRSDQDRL